MTGRALGLAASVLAVPLEAHAHGDAGWAHGVVDGARAFAGSLQHLLPVLAVALVARRRSRASVRNDVLSIVGGVSLGMFCSYLVSDALAVVVLARAQLVLLGLIALSNLQLSAALVSLLCIAAAGAVGLEYGVTPSGDPLARPAPALGFLLAAAAAFGAVALAAQHFQTGWQRIAIRVLGSWIAATGMIYLAFLIVQFR